MYFFVKFTYKDDEYLSIEPEGELLPCEWVIKADSKEDVIKQIKEDIELDEILELREISAEERIEIEKVDLFEMIKRDYIYRRHGDISIREYSKISREMENNLELQYTALREFNAGLRLTTRLSHRAGFMDMTMAEFNEKINQLIDAKDEEEFNKVLKSVQKK